MQKPVTAIPKSASGAANQNSKGQVVAVMTDLMFDSRLRSTAEAIGLNYSSVRSLEELKRSLETRASTVVIVDMEIEAISAPDAIAQAITHKPKPTVIAYYPHVHTKLQQQAVDAGADLVLPRSRFSTDITGILTAHAQNDEQESPGGAS